MAPGTDEGDLVVVASVEDLGAADRKRLPWRVDDRVGTAGGAKVADARLEAMAWTRAAALLVASLGYSTVDPWMARSMARFSRAIWEGPSAPISTPAWEPTSRRSTPEMAPCG